MSLTNPLGLKLLTRLGVGLSHFKEHKFKHNFHDSVDRLCSCRNKSTVDFFLHFPNFATQRKTLLNKPKSFNASVLAENGRLYVFN